MRDNESLLAAFKDAASTQEGAIFIEVNRLLQGKDYRRERDLANIIPCFDWELLEPKPISDPKEVSRTVHVIARLKAALETQQIKHQSGYDVFGLQERMDLLGALNAERRVLETQLHAKATEVTLDKTPTFRRQLEQGIANAMVPRQVARPDDEDEPAYAN